MRWIQSFAAALASAAAVATSAQPAKPADPDRATCAKLAAVIEHADIAEAAREVKSIGDNSAPRATLRRIELQNDLLKAQMAVDLMIAMRCNPLPLPPDGSSIRYLQAALECERSSATAAPSELTSACETAKWKPIGGIYNAR